MVKLSLFCSSIRPHLWESLFKSLEGTTEEIEFVFAGPLSNIPEVKLPNKISFKYIKTANIKPTQIYEVARRNCSGELISWTADDAEFPDDVLGKEYRFFKNNCKRIDVLSVRTKENYGTWQDCDGQQHRFFAASAKAPKMAPMGVMNREYFQELGGIDRRYICGQWDNDLVMRIYNNGGKMYHFGEAFILLDHLNKHDKRWGVSGSRPFGQGYSHDRAILEGSWGKRGQMKYDVFPYERYDNGFEPFEDKDLTKITQSYNMKELWDDKDFIDNADTQPNK